jgi:predicted nucleic acid-binding protein
VRLFFDANVLLDVLARREEWLDHSAAALSLVDSGRAHGFVAAHSVTTLSYLLTKHLGREKAATTLVDLLGLVRAVPVNHELLLKAFSLGWNDFEDAVQAVCALEADADYLITRNPGDFMNLPIPTVTPSELIALLERS